MKWNVFCTWKNHIPGRKKVNIFTFAYGQAGSGDPPSPPYGQPDRKVFFDAFPMLQGDMIYLYIV